MSPPLFALARQGTGHVIRSGNRVTTRYTAMWRHACAMGAVTSEFVPIICDKSPGGQNPDATGSRYSHAGCASISYAIPVKSLAVVNRSRKIRTELWCVMCTPISCR